MVCNTVVLGKAATRLWPTLQTSEMRSLQDTAAQLRCPSGATAAEAARMMNEIHGTLNRKCIEFMDITPGDRILETGPGNGAFVREIVEGRENVFRTGIDWSNDMVMHDSPADMS